MIERCENNGGIKEGQNYEIWHSPILSGVQFKDLSPENRLLYLASIGHMAPSTHNTQPWAFSLDPSSNSMNLYLDHCRVLPASDVRGRQANLSLGGVLANIKIAANFLGLSCECSIPFLKIEDKTQRYIHAINIKFNEAESSSNEELFRAVFSRRVNRSIYDTTRVIPEGIISRISEAASDGIAIHLIKKGDLRIPRIADVQARADNHVANNPHFARELGDWLQENGTESGLGMPGDTFNMTDEQSVHTKRALLGKEPMLADDIAAFSRGSQRGIETAGLVALLTTTENSPKQWFMGGEVLQKIGLFLTANNISYTVHAGLAEVPIVQQSLSLVFGTIKSPLIFLRAGYPRPDLPVPPHSPRLPLNEVLI
jgi:hypothetical protein